jgi:YcxB-like protein
MPAFQLTQEEYISARMGVRLKKRIMSWIWPNALIFVVIFGPVAGYAPILAIGIALLLFLLVPVANVFSDRIKSAKIFTQTKALQQSVSLDISEEGIRSTTPNSSLLCPWDDIHKWEENRQFVYIYLNDDDSQILPKRVLSVGDLDLIHDRLRNTEKV